MPLLLLTVNCSAVSFITPRSGINVRKGTISDMYAEHVIQPVLVNSSALKLATECVGMILKIDDVVAVM